MLVDEHQSDVLRALDDLDDRTIIVVNDPALILSFDFRAPKKGIDLLSQREWDTNAQLFKLSPELVAKNILSEYLNSIAWTSSPMTNCRFSYTQA